MDITLDQKHEMARDLYKQFAETEVKPLAQETDETEVFPEETVAKMGKYGFMGIPVPKEYLSLIHIQMCIRDRLMALATGADTHKMKYGHRGGNHPVKDLACLLYTSRCV